MKGFKTYILCALAFALIASSCTKQTREAIYNKQEEAIDKYVQTLIKQDTTRTVTYNGGSTRVTMKAGEGEALAAGGTISFYWGGYVFQNSFSKNNLFATNDRAQAEDAGWVIENPDDYTVTTFVLSKAQIISGLRNGLVGVKPGERCYIMFSGKHGFGSDSVGAVPANSALLYCIIVEDVKN